MDTRSEFEFGQCVWGSHWRSKDDMLPIVCSGVCRPIFNYRFSSCTIFQDVNRVNAIRLVLGADDKTLPVHCLESIEWLVL